MNMKEYIISYIELGHTLYWHCMADDYEHAKEQFFDDEYNKDKEIEKIFIETDEIEN